jgi:hypothetical protein
LVEAKLELLGDATYSVHIAVVGTAMTWAVDPATATEYLSRALVRLLASINGKSKNAKAVGRVLSFGGTSCPRPTAIIAIVVEPVVTWRLAVSSPIPEGQRKTRSWIHFPRYSSSEVGEQRS